MASFLAYPAYFLVAYVALTIALYMLGFVVSKAAFVARLLASVLCLIACALYGAAASIILYPFGKAQISQWATARAFKFVMTATTGLTFEVTDPKGILGSTRPAVFLGNHQSEMDVLMLGAMFPKYCSVAAKSSLRRTPFLGWFMILSGTIFIDRQNSKDARAALSGAVKQIRDKRQSVYMFPEGTRSYSKEPMLLPFKKGAFHLAVQAQVPIVPVVVANYSHVYFTKGGVFKPGKVPIKGRFFFFNRPRSLSSCLNPLPSPSWSPADRENK